MVTYLRIPVLLLIVLSLLFLTTCEELEREMLVVTGEVSNVSVSSADAGGQVIDMGQGATQHGHCYSKEPNVTVSDFHTRLGSPAGAGGFTSPLSDLEPGSLYYVKAYISNGDITVYGSEISFTTGDISPAVLTTSEVGSVTETTAVSGGNITSDGSSEVTVRGVVWSTSENPTLEDNEGFTEDGTGTGEFTSNLTGLTAGTTYYVRAYATNGAGTTYGNQQNFTTIEETVVTDIDGNQYQVVVIGQQRWLSSNLRVTRYRNGDLVVTGLTDISWEDASQGSSAVYPDALVAGINSQSDMVEAYGRLYNWFAVTDSRGLCPAGWRVPTDGDWDELTSYIEETEYSADVIGNALKSCRQVGSALGGDCSTDNHPRWDSDDEFYGADGFGFSALPGGMRYSNGEYIGLGEIGSWWSSTSLGDDNAWHRSIYYNSGIIDKSADLRQMGLSVRCIK